MNYFLPHILEKIQFYYKLSSGTLTLGPQWPNHKMSGGAQAPPPLRTLLSPWPPSIVTRHIPMYLHAV